ncbi:hypothetical protein [Paenibacillus aceris]|uniref:Uncharacterized protein n=1 Tax=Paenibacillus aceris TaxID=869555 RepID=A0ABS4I6Z8_9BACL|nr:hypothetical protein [Paenibacillus aceris]MBP1966694.1 hypothetical protein [Paenibacillus aceris]NHW34956.1 hypothetical protein [Paenibacillus aceris]
MRKKGNQIALVLCLALLFNVLMVCPDNVPTVSAESGSSSVMDNTYEPVSVFDKDFTTTPLGLTGSDLGFDYSSYTSGTASAVIEADPYTGTRALHLKANGIVTDGALRNEFQISKTFGEPYTGTISTEITFMQTGTKKDDRIIQFFPSSGTTFLVGAGVTADKGLGYLLSTAPSGSLGQYQLGEWHTIRLDFNTVSQKYSLYYDGNIVQARNNMNKSLPIYNLKRLVIAAPGTSGDLWIRGVKVTHSPFMPEPPAPKIVSSGSRNSRVMWTSEHYAYASKYRLRIKVKGESNWRPIGNATTFFKDYTGTNLIPASDINAFYDSAKLASTPLVNGQTYTLGLSVVTRDESGVYNNGVPRDFESTITEFDGTPYATTPVPTTDTSVIDQLTSSANYYGYLWKLQDGSKIGDYPFLDNATIQFEAIPNKYASMDRIVTTHKDVMRYPLGADGPVQNQLIGFNVKDQTTVYVAMDKNATLPAWLADWTNTGDVIKMTGANSGYTFNIYKKSFAAGSSVLLGYNDYANFDLSKNAGYFVMAERVTTGLKLDPVTEWVNTSTYKLSGSVSESVYVSVYQNKAPVTLPMGGFISGGGSFEWNLDLVSGANLFEVYANRDKSTFFDRVEATVNQDSIVPEIRIPTPPTAVREAVYMLEGSLSKAASLTIKLNGANVVDSVYQEANQSFSYPLTLEEGNNSIEVSTIDLAGNTNKTSYTMAYIFWAGQGIINDSSGNSVHTLTASKDIFAEKKVVNTTASKKQLTLWFILYDVNNTMIDFSSSIAELKPGETKTLGVGFTLPAQVTGYKVKVFIWDSLKDILGQSPLSEELVVQ